MKDTKDISRKSMGFRFEGFWGLWVLGLRLRDVSFGFWGLGSHGLGVTWGLEG